MIALRNFAAHESPQGKHRALDSISQKRVGSAGSWIKRQRRFTQMTTAWTKLADDIELSAPY